MIRKLVITGLIAATCSGIVCYNGYPFVAILSAILSLGIARMSFQMKSKICMVGLWFAPFTTYALQSTLVTPDFIDSAIHLLFIALATLILESTLRKWQIDSIIG